MKYGVWGVRLLGEAEAARMHGPSGQKSLMPGEETEWSHKPIRKKMGVAVVKRLERFVEVSNAMHCIIHVINLFLSILQQSQCQERETNFSITQKNTTLSASKSLPFGNVFPSPRRTPGYR